MYKYLKNKWQLLDRSLVRNFLCVEFVLFALLLVLTSYPVPMLAIDLNKEHCLNDVHLALLVPFRFYKAEIERGDLIYFEPSAVPELGYLKDHFVVKQVSGVPKDLLIVDTQGVWINQKQLAYEIPNATNNATNNATKDELKNHKFVKNERIGQAKYFVTGDNPRSNDSRYWGYLEKAQILGKAYKLL